MWATIHADGTHNPDLERPPMESISEHAEPSSTEPELSQYLLFVIQGGKFAVGISHVKELLLMPETTKLPEAPYFSRGVINLRGSIIPCSDTRRRFGMEGLVEVREQEVREMRERERGHVEWLQELESCAMAGTRFTKERDPTRCAFGRWYDAYLQRDDLTYDVLTFLKEFNEPHRRIHAVADQVDTLIAQGAKDKARQLIQQTRATHLKQMVSLFAEYYQRRASFDREVAIVLEYGGKTHAITADALESVDELKRVEPAPQGFASSIIKEIGHMKKGDETALVLHPSVFIP